MPKQQYLLEITLKRDNVPSFFEYPFCLDAVKNLHSLQLHPAVTFIIGENGSGKSTLLEAIAICLGFNPEGGSKNSILIHTHPIRIFFPIYGCQTGEQNQETDIF